MRKDKFHTNKSAFAQNKVYQRLNSAKPHNTAETLNKVKGLKQFGINKEVELDEKVHHNPFNPQYRNKNVPNGQKQEFRPCFISHPLRVADLHR